MDASAHAPKTVTVTPGTTLTGVGHELAARHLIRSALAWHLMVRLEAGKAAIKAGTYRVSPSQSAAQILAMLSSGKVAVHKVTIPEGFDVIAIAKRLQQDHIVSAEAFQVAARRWQNPYQKGVKGVRFAAEGYLFPATYSLPYGIDAQAIVKRMTKNFEGHLTTKERTLAASEHLSVNQLITVASLVEKEAKLSSERPLIAAVFLNRLRIHMPMQSDPTVAYALDKPLAHVSIKDERDPSPYNTYYAKGLPPGPICSPGMPSILAVLHPAHVPYLYFVGKPDGSHIFSTTYAQQLAAEAKVAKMKKSG